MSPLQEKLLNTPMHQLGIPGRFNGRFYHKEFKYSGDVMTLKQFIEYNNKIMPSGERFICFKPGTVQRYPFVGDGIKRNSSCWFNLKKFLLANGFTAEHFIHLLPLVTETKNYRRLDYAALGKEKVNKLPFEKVLGIKSTGQNYLAIKKFMKFKRGHLDGQVVTIKDILSLNNNDINTIYAYCAHRAWLTPVLNSMQRKLKDLKFTEDDGAFLSVKMTNSKTKDYHIMRLVKHRDFSLEEARLAVELGWLKEVS